MSVWAGSFGTSFGGAWAEIIPPALAAPLSVISIAAFAALGGSPASREAITGALAIRTSINASPLVGAP